MDRASTEQRQAEREAELAKQKGREAAEHGGEAARKGASSMGRQAERGVDQAQRGMERGAENLKEGVREKLHDAQDYAGRLGDEARREAQVVKRRMKPMWEDFKRTPNWLKCGLLSTGFLAGLMTVMLLGTLGLVTYKGTISFFQDPVSYQAHKSLDTVLSSARGGYGSGGGVMDYMTGGQSYVQNPWWTSFVPDAFLPYRYQSYSTRGRGMYENVYGKLQDLATTKSYKDSMFSPSSPNYLSRSIAASEDFLSNILHTIGDVSHRAGDKVHS